MAPPTFLLPVHVVQPGGEVVGVALAEKSGSVPPRGAPDLAHDPTVPASPPLTGDAAPPPAASAWTDVLERELVDELRSIHAVDGRTLLETVGRQVIDDMTLVLAQLDARRDRLCEEVVAKLAHRARADCLVIGARHAASAASVLQIAVECRACEFASQALDALASAWGAARQGVEAAISASCAS